MSLGTRRHRETNRHTKPYDLIKQDLSPLVVSSCGICTHVVIILYVSKGNSLNSLNSLTGLRWKNLIKFRASSWMSTHRGLWFYRPQVRSFYRCLSVHGGGGLCMMSHIPSRGVSVQGVSVQGVSVQEISVQGVSVRRHPPNQKSGRYASYWNAFLYYIRFVLGEEICQEP